MVELIKEIKTKSVMTKSAIPTGGYAVNPYIGCPHSCKYCYASFMKRFTGHSEEWGTFVDVKYWPPITQPQKYKNQLVVIGTVTDGYNPLEEKYKRTRAVLEQLKDSDAKISICTKSDLILRDLELLKTMSNITVSWSINTLDEQFKSDMDEAVSIERRIVAMKKVYSEGIRTVCFISPIFPGLTDVEAIIEKVKDFTDFIWIENLNLRGSYKAPILSYIREKRVDLYPLYEEIYINKNLRYWKDLEEKIKCYAEKNEFPLIDNHLPDGRSIPGYPRIINFLYHEQIRNSQNTGKRTLNA